MDYKIAWDLLSKIIDNHQKSIFSSGKVDNLNDDDMVRIRELYWVQEEMYSIKKHLTEED